MVNPHISLNLWNPLIPGTTLRFSKDFYCKIHRFCWQSSDLAQRIYLFKPSSGSEEFILFVWVSVWHLDRLHFTQSPLSVPLSLQMVFLRSFRTQIWTQIGSGCGSVCVRLIPYFLLYSSSHHEIPMVGMKSTDFLINPWVNHQIVWISLNPWIYGIYLGVFNFKIFNSNSKFKLPI